MKYDQSELAFRVLFSLIFLGLGMEHLFSDAVIRAMMPDWIIGQRWVSLASGAILLTGGSLILLGYRMRLGALLLGGFLLLVTAVIHGPNLIVRPSDLPHEWGWLWDVYQRSNFLRTYVCWEVASTSTITNREDTVCTNSKIRHRLNNSRV